MKKIIFAIIAFTLFIPGKIWACDFTVTPSTFEAQTPTTVTFSLINNGPWPVSNFYVTDVNHMGESNPYMDVNCPWGGQFQCWWEGYTHYYQYNYGPLTDITFSRNFTVTMPGSYTFAGSGGNDNCPSQSVTVTEKLVAYSANPVVTASVTGLLGSMVSGYLGIIPTALSIIGGLMVTLFLVRKLIGWVRGNMQGGDDTTSFESAEKWWSKNHDKYGESYHNDSSTEIVNLYNKHHKKKAKE